MNKETGTLDLLGILQIGSYLLKKKFPIISGTLACGLLGAIYAFLAPAIYRSEAVIGVINRSGQSNASGVLSQLGGFGGLVASQFGVGESDLNRLEILTKNREVIGELVRSERLLPVLFPDKWDNKNSKWKNNEKIPTEKIAVELIRKNWINIESDPKKKILTITLDAPDSSLSYKAMKTYLEILNRKITQDAKRDAENNIAYLEQQSERSQDPQLKEKISQLIAIEMEKSMLGSVKAFDVLEEPIVPMFREAPKKKRIVLTSLFAGFFISVFSILCVKYLKEIVNDVGE